MSCSDCTHSAPNVTDDNELTLICRRYPPSVIVIDPEAGHHLTPLVRPMMIWPQVEASWRCGEHTPDGTNGTTQTPT